MGYSYDKRTGRLVCDDCGHDGGVRKRKCVYLIHGYDNYRKQSYSVPYCPPPALCADCYKRAGGAQGIHGDSCKTGAARAQQDADERHRKLAAGAYLLTSASGDWADSVPPQCARAWFRNQDGHELAMIIRSTNYARRDTFGAYLAADDLPGYLDLSPAITTD